MFCNIHRFDVTTKSLVSFLRIWMRNIRCLWRLRHRIHLLLLCPRLLCYVLKVVWILIRVHSLRLTTLGTGGHCLHSPTGRVINWHSLQYPVVSERPLSDIPEASYSSWYASSSSSSFVGASIITSSIRPR